MTDILRIFGSAPRALYSEAMLPQRSSRAFTEEPVPEENLEKVLRAAMSAHRRCAMEPCQNSLGLGVVLRQGCAMNWKDTPSRTYARM